MIEMQNGCICCMLQSNPVSQIIQLTQKKKLINIKWSEETDANYGFQS